MSLMRGLGLSVPGAAPPATAAAAQAPVDLVAELRKLQVEEEAEERAACEAEEAERLTRQLARHAEINRELYEHDRLTYDLIPLPPQLARDALVAAIGGESAIIGSGTYRDPRNARRNCPTRWWALCPACKAGEIVFGQLDAHSYRWGWRCWGRCDDASAVEEIIRRAAAQAEAAARLAAEEARTAEEHRRAEEEAARQADPARCDLEWLALEDWMPEGALAKLTGAILARGGRWLAGDRHLGPCPACVGTDRLVVGRDGDGYAVGRCLDGCETDRIGEALEGWLSADEQRAAAARTRAAMEACSIGRTREAPPTEWQVDGLAPRGHLVLTLGAKGARKTMRAMHAALCIAAGVPYLDRPVKRGRVLLVLQEGGDAQIARYLDALARGLGVDVNELEGEWLFIYHSPLKVDDEGLWQAFTDTVEAIEPAWIAIDNLGKVRARTSQGAGNDNSVIGAIMERLEWLAQRSRVRPGIELLHHVNARDEALGASASGNSADLEFRLSARSAANDALVTMVKGGKDRTGRAAERLAFRFVDRDDGAIVPMLADSAGDKAVGKAAGGEEPWRAALRKLLAAGPASGRGISEALGWSQRDVPRRCGAMAPEVERGDDGLWRLAES